LGFRIQKNFIIKTGKRKEGEELLLSPLPPKLLLSPSLRKKVSKEGRKEGSR